MTTFFDETAFVRPTLSSEEKFVLSRKNGKLRLKVKSPLFEDFFREQSKGEVGPLDPLWGHRLYKVKIDPQVEQDLSTWGVTFSGVKGLWGGAWGEMRVEGSLYGGGEVNAPANITRARPLRLNPTPWADTPSLGEAQSVLFNVSFLLAQGLGQGLDFDLAGHIPLSLVEGPKFTFTNTLRNGLFQVMKQFIMDFEATIVIQSDVKL